MKKSLLFALFGIIAVFSSPISAKEKEVTVYNTPAGITLAGTLAVPEGTVPEIFVVLASGSGAQNRDEEVFGHRPFKVISDALVADGIGVLRMDDRGVGGSQGVFENATIDDFTTDIMAGVNELHNLYPHAKIGIIGHSQGGQVAVKAAARGGVDFIVTLAGPAWPGDSIIMSQARALSVATTGTWPGEQLERNLLDIAKSDISPIFAKPLLYNEFVNTLGDYAKVPQVQEQIYKQIEPLVSPMYRDLLRYDPSDDIRNVSVPWLALNGDKDLQVLVENLSTIKELNPSAETIVVKGHNHLFQEAVTGLPDEYAGGGPSPSEMTINILIENLNRILNKK